MKIKAYKLLKLLEINNTVIYVSLNKNEFMNMFFDVIDLLKESDIEFEARIGNNDILIGDKKILFSYGEKIAGLNPKSVIVDEHGLVAIDGVSNIVEVKH